MSEANLVRVGDEDAHLCFDENATKVGGSEVFKYRDYNQTRRWRGKHMVGGTEQEERWPKKTKKEKRRAYPYP